LKFLAYSLSNSSQPRESFLTFLSNDFLRPISPQTGFEVFQCFFCVLFFAIHTVEGRDARFSTHFSLFSSTFDIVIMAILFSL
jgi:hypothetical protein